MGETVLVTGGTGFVGGWCIIALLRRGYAVRTTARSLSKEPAVRAAVASAADCGEPLNLLRCRQVEGTIFSDIAVNRAVTFSFTKKSVQTSTAANGAQDIFVFNSVGTEPGRTNDALKSTINVIARAGYLVTPNLLLHGLGGLSLGHFVISATQDAEGPNPKWVAGYTAGAGGELELTGNWSLRGEYRYSAFDYSRGFNQPNVVMLTTANVPGTFRDVQTVSNSTSNHVDCHMGKIGVAYKFCPCN